MTGAGPGANNMGAQNASVAVNDTIFVTITDHTLGFGTSLYASGVVPP